MFASWIRSLRPEDPRRIRAFRDTIQAIEWDGPRVAQGLDQLFQAVDVLAAAEVDYYYRRRRTRAWISGVARFFAWSLGTIGLLLPLLAAANGARFSNLQNYGYVFLAAAASCLGANSLFGGTVGHIRFVSTQLELEKLITQARITWCEYLAESNAGQPDIQAGFAKIRDYAQALHETTIAETGRWGEVLLKELAKYQKQIGSRNSQPGR